MTTLFGRKQGPVYRQCVANYHASQTDLTRNLLLQDLGHGRARGELVYPKSTPLLPNMDPEQHNFDRKLL